ncbi:DNA recombination protein RmuC [Hydrogenispora ethanolica]|uniref:DNA recombination protein RmuC n=1 Tax=Hydrogenispora ethanolica TaxID=1082276 RepID=A0A4R1RY32_HYDET|nr:DNA recombination protein RmuC [Hydrogenispora ethanolica]TCL71683.1 DNA recombination protein RmuC [Hydrogenispora ethanolica]
MASVWQGMLIFGGGLVSGILISLCVGKLRRRSRVDSLRELEELSLRLKDSFAAISYEALNRNTEQFLNLAAETLQHQSRAGEQALDTKKQLIDQSLDSMNKEIGRVHELVNLLERDRQQKFGELSSQLRQAVEQTARLRETTDSLRSVLGNSRIRGQWGERMAEDILRTAGLIEGVNYRKQQWSGAGSRPDFTFLLPKNLKLNMDVKFPLDNFLLFMQCEEENRREEFKQQFLKDVRNRMKEVTTRDYINPAENTLDYVLVFIPNEQIYGFIHESDGSLLDEAIRNRVILCSPLTLYAFLAVIRQAVENFNLERTTGEILSLMGSFYKQWEAFCSSCDRLGKRLEDAQKEYAALITTRRNQLEKPLRYIEELRKQNGLPLEPLTMEAAATGEAKADSAEK